MQNYQGIIKNLQDEVEILRSQRFQLENEYQSLRTKNSQLENDLKVNVNLLSEEERKEYRITISNLHQSIELLKATIQNQTQKILNLETEKKVKVLGKFYIHLKKIIGT